MKAYLKFCFSLLLVLPLAAWSQPNNGAVLGGVMNASLDSVAMAGQEVVLYQYVDGREVEGPRPHTVTDTQGRFVFEGLEVGERFAYYPLAVFASIEFSGVLVKPSPFVSRQQSDIFVFEPTSSDSTISTTRHHIILEPNASSIAVRELFLFTNRGNYTYVGSMPSGSKKNIVLRLEAPENATELQYGGDLMSCCVVVKGNQIFDTMEFKPGARQVMLNYLLPYQGERANLTKTLGHQTAALDIFLPKGSGAVSAPQLSEEAPFQIHGREYRRYHAETLAKGNVLSLNITDLPAAPRDWRWLAPVMLVLIIVSGYAMNRWRKSRTINERRLLIEQILQLDENFEFGEIDEASYQSKCVKLVQKVLALEDEGANGSGNEITENARRKSDEDK